MQFNPEDVFGEDGKDVIKQLACEGMGPNAIISTLLVTALLSKSQYEKIVQILEAGTGTTATYAKALLYS